MRRFPFLFQSTDGRPLRFLAFRHERMRPPNQLEGGKKDEKKEANEFLTPKCFVTYRSLCSVDGRLREVWMTWRLVSSPPHVSLPLSQVRQSVWRQVWRHPPVCSMHPLTMKAIDYFSWGLKKERLILKSPKEEQKRERFQKSTLFHASSSDFFLAGSEVAFTDFWIAFCKSRIKSSNSFMESSFPGLSPSN